MSRFPVQRASPLISEEEAGRRESFELSHALCAIWRDLRAEGRARRAAIDPVLLGPRLLPHLVILTVLDGGADFQWRLFGGAHVDEYGVNLTGAKLSEIMAQQDGVEEVREIFQACQQTADPTFYSIRYLSRDRVLRACNGVILPLFADDGTTVEHLLGCSQWIDVRP